MPPIGSKTLALCVLGALALGASAADAGRAADIHARYLEERALCDGKPAEDRKTCLREAGAARIEARRGTLLLEESNFERNRLARCAYHTQPDERGYCERRMRGEGTTTGSVEGGGILRELVVTVPATGDSAGSVKR